MRLLTLGCALFSLAAVADPKPTLAAWPIEFSADSIFAPNQSEHQRQFVSTVRDACGLPTPLRSELMAAQSPLKGGSCATDDACLAKFAQVTHARYALSAQLSVTSAGTVSMTGRIVRDDSVRVREGTVQLKTGKLSNADVLKKLTELLLLELETASLQMQTPVAVAPVKTEVKVEPRVEPKAEPKVETPVTPVVTAPVEPQAPVMVEAPVAPVTHGPGRVLVIAGAAGVAAGAALFAGSALMANGTFESGGSAEMRIIKTGEVGTFNTARTLSGVSFGVMGVGAAVAVVGAILWGTEAPVDTPRVSLVPVAGGAVGVVSASF